MDLHFQWRVSLSLFRCLLVFEYVFKWLLHELRWFSFWLGLVFCAFGLFHALFAATFFLLIGRSVLLFLRCVLALFPWFFSHRWDLLLSRWLWCSPIVSEVKFIRDRVYFFRLFWFCLWLWRWLKWRMGTWLNQIRLVLAHQSGGIKNKYKVR